MPRCGMLRMTRLRMVTSSMSWLCARNAAWLSSLVVQPVPSRIAPYSPTNVLPVFGVIALRSEWMPALRQNVVFPGLSLMAAWMLVPGEMLIPSWTRNAGLWASPRRRRSSAVYENAYI